MLDDAEFYRMMGGGNSAIYKKELQTISVGKTLYEKKQEIIKEVIFPAINKILSASALTSSILFPGFGDLAALGIGGTAVASIIDNTNAYLGLEATISKAEYTAYLGFIAGIISKSTVISSTAKFSASAIAGFSQLGIPVAVAILSLPTTNIAAAWTVYDLGCKYSEEILSQMNSYGSNLNEQIIKHAVQLLQSMGIIPDFGEIFTFLRDFIAWKTLQG